MLLALKPFSQQKNPKIQSTSEVYSTPLILTINYKDLIFFTEQDYGLQIKNKLLAFSTPHLLTYHQIILLFHRSLAVSSLSSLLILLLAELCFLKNRSPNPHAQLASILNTPKSNRDATSLLSCHLTFGYIDLRELYLLLCKRLLNLQWCLEENVGWVKQLKLRRRAQEKAGKGVKASIQEGEEGESPPGESRESQQTHCCICSYQRNPGNFNALAHIPYSIFKLLISYRPTTPY